MARETFSESDEDLWEYTSSQIRRTGSKSNANSNSIINPGTNSKPHTPSNITPNVSSATSLVGTANLTRKRKGGMSQNKSQHTSTTRKRKSPWSVQSEKGSRKRSNTKRQDRNTNVKLVESQSNYRTSIKDVPQSNTRATIPLYHMGVKGKTTLSSDIIKPGSKHASQSDSHSTTPPIDLAQSHSQAQTIISPLNKNLLGSTFSGNCPFCQMPFKCLILQSPGGHANLCTSAQLKATNECKDGGRCDNTLESHYKKFRHTLLAKRRSGLEVPSPQKEAGEFSPIKEKHVRQLDFNNSAQKISPSVSGMVITGHFTKSSTVSTKQSPYFDRQRASPSSFLKSKRPQTACKSTSKRQLAFLPSTHCSAISLTDQSEDKEQDDDSVLDTEEEDIFLGCTLPSPVAPEKLPEKVTASNAPWETADDKDISDMLAAALEDPTTESDEKLMFKPIEECCVETFTDQPKTEYSNECMTKQHGYCFNKASQVTLMFASKEVNDFEDKVDKTTVKCDPMSDSPPPISKVLMMNKDSISQSLTPHEPVVASKSNDANNISSKYLIDNEVGTERVTCFANSQPHAFSELDTVSDLLDIKPEPSKKNVAKIGSNKDDDINDLFTGISSSSSSAGNHDIMTCIAETVLSPSSSGKTIPRTLQRHTMNSAAKATHKLSVGKLGIKQTVIQRFFSSNSTNSKEKKEMASFQIGAKTVPPENVENCSLAVPPPSGSKYALFSGVKRSTVTFAETKKTSTIIPESLNGGRGYVTPSTTARSSWSKKQCPFYKKMPGTPFTVDAFKYGLIPGCKAYILTHFHYDHYGGLTKKFNQPIYCSKITGNLVVRRLKVNSQFVNTIPLDTPRMVEGVELTFMEANHCPGSVIILFRMSNGHTYLHTGDFRASRAMENYPALQSVRIDKLYLDTTYCDTQYAFPPQKEVVAYSVAKTEEFLREFPNALIVVGSYTIGKERIFMAIAEAVGARVCVTRDKLMVLECLEDAALSSRLTLNRHEARVHVLPMHQLKYENLSEYLSKLKPRYDCMLAFEPTGWTHARGTRQAPLNQLRPKVKRDRITLYGVPYSEHSSYVEMRRFCQVMQPASILATVNNGDAVSRARMVGIFEDWMKTPPHELHKELRQPGLKGWVT